MTITLSTLAPLEGQKLWGFIGQARKIRLVREETARMSGTW